MKYIILKKKKKKKKKFFFFFSRKVAGANVRVGGQMRRAPACFDTPDYTIYFDICKQSLWRFGCKLCKHSLGDSTVHEPKWTSHVIRRNDSARIWVIVRLSYKLAKFLSRPRTEVIWACRKLIFFPEYR